MDLDRYLENVVNIWMKIVIFRKLNIKIQIIFFFLNIFFLNYCLKFL
jgi:hypothetical protein